MKIIWIKNADIQDANIRQNSWVISPTFIFQANMFAHALGRKIGIQPEGVIYIHRNFIPNGLIITKSTKSTKSTTSTKFYPNQPKGLTTLSVKNQYDQSTAAQLQPTVTSHVTITLGLVFGDDTLLNTEEIQQHVNTMRIAGGSIINTTVKMQEDVYTIDDVRRYNKGGFLLIDRKDLLTNVKDKLDTVIDLVSNRNISWLSATNLGYMLCETPTRRDGIRNNQSYYHACVESMIGLVQQVPINNEDIDFIPIWKYTEHSQYVCVEANSQ